MDFRDAVNREFARRKEENLHNPDWITGEQVSGLQRHNSAESPRNTAKTVQSAKKISCLVPLGSKTAEQTHKHRNRFEDYVCQKKIINNSDVLVGFVSVPQRRSAIRPTKIAVCLLTTEVAASASSTAGISKEVPSQTKVLQSSPT